MTKAGLNPGKDVTLVQQQFDMQALLKGDIDAAQAMIYNEYAQVLEAKNPKTGKLYTPEDFNRIDWNTEGTAMLQDAIWANTEKLKRQGLPGPDGQVPGGELQGLDVLPRQRREVPRHRRRAGSKLGASHQLWQMNEINKLIWPSPNGIGMVDKAAWDQTVNVAINTKNDDGDTVLTKAPEGLAFTNEYAEKALAASRRRRRRRHGPDFKPITVKLNRAAPKRWALPSGTSVTTRGLDLCPLSRLGAWRRGPCWRWSGCALTGCGSALLLLCCSACVHGPRVFVVT